MHLSKLIDFIVHQVSQRMQIKNHLGGWKTTGWNADCKNLNLTVLQRYELGSLKEEEEKDTDLSNWEWVESVRIKVRGRVYKCCIW